MGVNRAGTPWIFSSLQEGQRRPCGPSFTLSGAKAVPPAPAWLAQPCSGAHASPFPASLPTLLSGWFLGQTVHHLLAQ